MPTQGFLHFETAAQTRVAFLLERVTRRIGTLAAPSNVMGWIRACALIGLAACAPTEAPANDLLGCEDMGRVSHALLIGPEECNPCSPSCAISMDRPNDADLTPGNSSGVEYDPGTGGIVIIGMGGLIEDDDGDGVPNDADECPGVGWTLPCDGDVGNDGFYHTLPLGGAVEVDPFDFETRITTADVYFLMDTTGSMGQEIANLSASLISGTYDSSCPAGPGGGVIGAIQCVIPDAWFGVGRFDDYPVSPYGGGSDRVYVHSVDITNGTGSAAVAVGGYFASGGADGPESNTQALWAIATGGALGSYLPAKACPAGRWGYPCFRASTIPIVIMLTDAPFHDGPSDVNAYDRSSFATGVPKSWAETINALNANDVRVITVQSCGGQGWCSDGQSHAVALGNATDSVDGGGAPYVFSIPADGTGLDSAVVDAVRDLAENTLFDVTARPVDNPATPAIDETGFVDGIAAVSFPPGRCAGISGDTFLQCMPGTPVDFEVGFANDFVTPTAVPQVFDFTIEVLMDGTVQDSIPVRVVVPPVTTYPPTGTYQHTYDSTAFCNIPPERPDWNEMAWSVQTPADTYVTFELRAANTLAELPAATPVSITVPPTTSPIDVGDVLASAGAMNMLPYLQIVAVLHASSDMTQTPTLVGFDLAYRCVIIE